MNIKIDKARNKIEAVDPLTGKIVECNVVKKRVEKEPLDLTSQLEEANATIAKQAALIDFCESNISTMTAKDWQDYNALKEG